MKSELNKKIIEKIRGQHLAPKPKIFFVLKNVFFWSLFLLSILLGTISFATILYNFSGNQEILQNLFLKNNLSLETINFFPIFWIVILILFLLLSIKNYKKTERFYKYNINFIFLIVIILSFGIGSIMFSLGVGEKTEKLSQEYLPFYGRYQKIMIIKKEIFKNKLVKIGVTSQILEEHPELKKKIDKKFRENVLGKTYLFVPEECSAIKYTCPEYSISFSDSLGCGCRNLYLK